MGSQRARIHWAARRRAASVLITVPFSPMSRMLVKIAIGISRSRWRLALVTMPKGGVRARIIMRRDVYTPGCVG